MQIASTFAFFLETELTFLHPRPISSLPIHPPSPQPPTPKRCQRFFHHMHVRASKHTQSSSHHPSASKYTHTYILVRTWVRGGPGAPDVVGSEHQHHLGLADRVQPTAGARAVLWLLTWPCANCRFCDASWSDQGYLMSPHCLPLLPRTTKCPPGEENGPEGRQNLAPTAQ